MQTMALTTIDSRLSMQQSLLATCLMALVTHQILKRLETYSIVAYLSLVGTPMLFSFELLRGTVSAPWAALVSSATFLSTLLVSVTVYRLSPFHPLARYPGPLACKLSKFWMACISATGYQHLYFKRLHETYGDVVRTGPNELSFRDLSVFKPMLGVGGLPRGPYLVGRVLSDTDIPFAAVMDPIVHAERKKPWIRALGTSALKVYEPMIANRTMQLMRVLEEQTGEVNIGDFFNYFSYDIMCDVTYGGGSELLRDGDTDNVWHFIDEALPSSTFLSHVPYLGILCGKLPMFRPAMDRLINFSKSVTAKRLERGSTIKDIFYYLNNEDLPEKDPPPERHLLDDSLLAIVAGSDTTSSALTSLVYCLLTHPSALKNLQMEIDRFYPADADPCDSKHHREMHYLTAVLNENLRLYPPGPTSTQCRVPHGSNDVMLGPYLVPAGTTVMLPPYTLQRDPRHFSPFTEDFWPERWLVATGELSLADALANAPGEADPQTFAHNEAAFIPFSHGPKGCAGKQLGMQELRTVTIALLQKFQLRLRPGWDTKQFDKNFKDYYVTTRPEVPVTLYPRF